MENTESYKTKESYEIGQTVYDDITGEVFQVVDCKRIGLLEDFKFMVIVKEVKNG